MTNRHKDKFTHRQMCLCRRQNLCFCCCCCHFCSLTFLGLTAAQWFFSYEYICRQLFCNPVHETYYIILYFHAISPDGDACFSCHQENGLYRFRTDNLVYEILMLQCLIPANNPFHYSTYIITV